MNVFPLKPQAADVPFRPLALGEEAHAAAYQHWLTGALAAAQAAVPQAPPITAHTFGLTTAATDLFPAQTPALWLTTASGDYLACYPEFCFQNGKLAEQAQQVGNYVARPLRLKNALLTFFAQEIGKALLKETYPELYEKFWPANRDKDILKDLDKLRQDIRVIVREVVQDALKQYGIEQLENFFIETRDWLRTTYKHEMQEHAKGRDIGLSAVHDDLHRRQSAMQSVTSILEARLSEDELRSCSYLTRLKVMLYAASLSMRIVLLKEQCAVKTMLQAQGKPGFDPSALQSELTEFHAHGLATLADYRHRLEQGRLGFITAVKHVNNQYTTMASAWSWFVGEEVYRGEAYYEWLDPFVSDHPDDAFKGGPVVYKVVTALDSVSHRLTPLRERAQADREAHLTDVRSLFTQYVGRPLDSVLDNLRAAPLRLGSPEPAGSS